jgi:hypothetical protein
MWEARDEKSSRFIIIIVKEASSRKNHFRLVPYAY